MNFPVFSRCTHGTLLWKIGEISTCERYSCGSVCFRIYDLTQFQDYLTNVNSWKEKTFVNSSTLEEKNILMYVPQWMWRLHSYTSHSYTPWSKIWLVYFLRYRYIYIFWCPRFLAMRQNYPIVVRLLVLLLKFYFQKWTSFLREGGNIKTSDCLRSLALSAKAEVSCKIRRACSKIPWTTKAASMQTKATRFAGHHP